jgi:hypothetical protein
LKTIDAAICQFLQYIREGSAELNRLRNRMDDLKRLRRAMGPVVRERRAGSSRAVGGPRKMSLLTAAANLLAENGQTMNCNAIVQELDERGVWSSPGGKTPGSTLYASANREIMEKGDHSRFVRVGKGQYAASEYGKAQYRAEAEKTVAVVADAVADASPAA